MDQNERKQGEVIYADLKQKAQQQTKKEDVLNGLF